MLRRTMPFLGLLLVAAVSLAGWLTATQVGAAYPHGTSHSIGLDLQRTTVSKDEIIESFDELADARQAKLIKVHSRWHGDQPVEEFIVFGDLAVADSASESHGQVLGSDEIGTRDLSGQYALGDCQDCAAEFIQLARSLGAEITWVEERDVPAVLTELSGSGTGMAYLAILLLTLTFSVFWNSEMARSRNIRAVAGHSRARIVRDDNVAVLVSYGVPSILAAMLVTVFAYALMPPALFPVMSGIIWFGTVATIGLALVINAWMISLTINVEAVARRETTGANGLTAVTIGARVFALVLVLVAIPYSISVGLNATSAMREAQRWSDARSYVKVANSTLILEDEEGYSERFATFISAMGESGIAAMSFSVDQMIDMPSEVLAPYDHWIVTDSGFLQAMQISENDLTELRWAEIPPALQDEIASNLEFWSAGESLEYSLYSWAGERSFPSLGSVASDGNAVISNDPIILMPADPYSDLDAQLLLSPLVSNGQVVFANGAELERAIEDFGLSPYVSSIDNLADQIADSARSYGQQAVMAVLSLGLAAVSLVVIIVQSARSWAVKNRRAIFAQLTSGHSPWSVARSPLAVEIVVLLTATATTVLLSLAFFRIRNHLLLVALLVLVITYVSAVALAYMRSITSQLQESISRRN